MRAGETVVLGREESHHLLRVMRAREGQSIRVFGGGREHEAVLLESRDGNAVVRVGGEVPAVVPPSVRLVFAVPWLKGGRTEFVIQKLTELGAAGITACASRREVSHGAEARLGRLRKVSMEACKQCGRSDVPDVHLAGGLMEVLDGVAADVAPRCRLLLYENEKSCLLSQAVRSILDDPDLGYPLSGPAMLVASGPEGGLAPDEIEMLRHHYRLVSLGPRTLRAETAPIAACAAILALCGDL